MGPKLAMVPLLLTRILVISASTSCALVGCTGLGVELVGQTSTGGTCETSIEGSSLLQRSVAALSGLHSAEGRTAAQGISRSAGSAGAAALASAPLATPLPVATLARPEPQANVSAPGFNRIGNTSDALAAELPVTVLVPPAQEAKASNPSSPPTPATVGAVVNTWIGSSPGGGTSVLRLLNASHVPLTVKKNHLNSAKAAEEVRNVAKDGMLPATGIMMAAFVLGSLMGSFSYTKFIPEMLWTVLVAVLLGLIIRNMLQWGWISLGAFTLVDATILNLFLLPVIIFEGGWSVNAPHFMDQFPFILIFAILGTLISIIVIGSFSWVLALQGVHNMVTLRANFAFASLISATDPVATLTTFAQLNIAKKQPLLNTLVFGESMINDAVAIVFFNAFNYAGHESWEHLLVRMLFLLFGSMFLGAMTAAALTLVLRGAQLPGHTMPEVLFVFLCPYFVYSLAETLDFSGIIATLFAGIVMKLYGARHFTDEGEKHVNKFLEAVARFADSGVFIICGTSVALMTSLEGFRFGFLALGLCLFARAISVLICTGLSNRLKRSLDRSVDDMITWKHEFMIWLSGLRGGLGLVLALEIDENWCGSENKAKIINTTFFLVCALLLFCGGTTQPCLKMLGLAGHSEEGNTALSASSGSAVGALRTSSDFQIAASSRGPWRLDESPLHIFLEWALVGEGKRKRTLPRM